MKQKILVKNIAEPTETSSGGQKWSVQTDKGYMSTFNEEIVDQLIKGVYNEVEVETKGKYKNITAWYSASDEEVSKVSLEDDQTKRNKSAAVSNAVSLVNSGKIELKEVGDYAQKLYTLIREIK